MDILIKNNQINCNKTRNGNWECEYYSYRDNQNHKLLITNEDIKSKCPGYIAPSNSYLPHILKSILMKIPRFRLHFR